MLTALHIAGKFGGQHHSLRKHVKSICCLTLDRVCLCDCVCMAHRLKRLAALHVVGSVEGNTVELPPGFGTLTALTRLRFEMVGHTAHCCSELRVEQGRCSSEDGLLRPAGLPSHGGCRPPESSIAPSMMLG